MAKTARLGMGGYARVLAALRDKPMTYMEGQAATGIRHNSMHRIFNSMYALGMVHIADWMIEPDRPTAPRFGMGHADDAPPPVKRPNGKRVTKAKMPPAVVPAPELVAMKSLLQAVQEPATALEVIAATGVSPVTVRNALAEMHRLRLVHIALWTPRAGNNSGAPVPNYQIGRAADAPRPKPLAQKARQRNYESRQAAQRQHAAMRAIAVHWLTEPKTAGQPAQGTLL